MSTTTATLADQVIASVARGDYEAGSDVDLAVEFDREAGIGLIEVVGLEQRLSALLSREVQLVPEPVEKQRLQANIDRDRCRAF